MSQEYDEEILLELDTLLDCIKETVDEYKQNIKEAENKDFQFGLNTASDVKKEFFPIYITLEDKILSILYQLKKDKYEQGGKYVERFVPYWSDFQEKWGKDMWEEYNEIRGCIQDDETNNSCSNDINTREYNQLEKKVEEVQENSKFLI